MTCSKVLAKSWGRGHENFSKWVYTSYFNFHDAQSQVRTLHTCTTKVMQLKSWQIVFKSVSCANMININAPLLVHIYVFIMAMLSTRKSQCRRRYFLIQLTKMVNAVSKICRQVIQNKDDNWLWKVQELETYRWREMFKF
jgi:F0F1-type ATP synthase membrane subunit a